MRMIGLEEHFVTEELAGYGAGTATIAQPHVWAEASRRLLDLTEERLPAMDAAGLDVQVLSLNSPGIQAEQDPAVAVARAAAVNDLLAGTIAEHPTRFAGFAALPLQDPQAAARELERAVDPARPEGRAGQRAHPRRLPGRPDAAAWSGSGPSASTCRCTCTRPTAWTPPTCCPATPSWSVRCGAGAPTPPPTCCG